MCTVSVIVPVYNVKEYLDICIESLIRQTFSDIEILLIDDGSTDGSSEICNRWLSRDNRIRVIHQKNQGVSVARNIGLNNAVGEWISFVDGDDYVSEKMIEVLFEETKQTDRIDLVIGSYYSDEDNKIIEEHFFKENRVINSDDKEILIKLAVGIDVFGLAGKTNIGVPWSKLYRRKTIDEIRFQTGLKRMQDMIFNLSFFYLANEIRYIDIPIYYYRINKKSAVRQYSKDFECIAKEIIIILEKQLSMYSNIEKKEAIIQYKKLSLLVETIKLGYIDKNCDLALKQKLKNIKRLCDLPIYYDAIYEASDIYLNWKYKYLKQVLKWKLYWFVYIMIWIRYN